MGINKAQDSNANNNAKDSKVESGTGNKPASAGWNRLKGTTAKPASGGGDESTKDKNPLIRPPSGGEKKDETGPSKPKSAGWNRLKGASAKPAGAKTEETKLLKEEPTPPAPPAAPTLNAKERWGKSKELLGLKSNGNVKPALTRADSLVVPGQTQRPSISFSEGRDSLSLGSRRGSRFSGESRFSAIDLSKLAAAQNIPEEEEEEDSNKGTQSETYIQLAIPYLPLWLAALCLVLNVLIPGTGTVLSGLSVYCCGKVRVESKGEDQKASALCTNLFVGIAQFFTITFMLVGWFWSLTWGIYMIILAVEREKEVKKSREAKLQAMALTAFNPQVRPWTLSRNS